MEGLKISAKVGHALEDFVIRLRDIYKDGLISVILYGSAVRGEFSDRFSNINVLVVLEDAGLENLIKACHIINSRRFEIFNVIFFTGDYIKRSADVFPVEFLDMKENHSVLYGEDVLKDLAVDTRHLRFQCEQELKSKLINIKRRYLKITSPGDLRNLLFGSATSVLHIMRNLVRLKGRVPAYSQENVLSEIAEDFQINTDIFKKILNAKLAGGAISHKDADSLFMGLAKELERITGVVDRL